MEQMRKCQGGLSVPTYMVDTPGQEGKIPLEPYHIVPCSSNDALIRNYQGKAIHYQNP
jgi:lysine 2,3-aminomutase